MLNPEFDAENLLLMGSLYNLLAKSFTPDAQELEKVLENLSTILKSTNITAAAPLLKSVQDALIDPAATEGYVRLFDMGGAPPYETSYTCRGHPYRKTYEEADIAGFYKAFGMRTKGELPDHIAAELEFVAFLYVKEGYALLSGNAEGAEVTREARQKFLNEHLMKWLGQFKDEVAKQSRKPLYPLVLQLLDSIISDTRQCSLKN